MCLQAGKVREASAAFAQGAACTASGKSNVSAMRIQVRCYVQVLYVPWARVISAKGCFDGCPPVSSEQHACGLLCLELSTLCRSVAAGKPVMHSGVQVDTVHWMLAHAHTERLQLGFPGVAAQSCA